MAEALLHLFMGMTILVTGVVVAGLAGIWVGLFLLWVLALFEEGGHG